MQNGGRSRLLIAVVVTVLLTAGCTSAAQAPVSSRTPGTPGPERSERYEPPATRTPSPASPRPTTSAPAPPTRWLSATAVDGDTIRLADGQSVRVVGIDTPEAGQCGYEQSSAVTATLIRDGVVLRRAKGENRDHYGRLLRYVGTRHGDLGTLLLRRGLAIARYDSQDGYGWHPLEDGYHRIDDTVAQVCPVTQGQLGAPPAETGYRRACDPNYAGPCVPRVPQDLDCADISGPVRILGSDPHRFDGDGDRLGCE